MESMRPDQSQFLKEMKERAQVVSKSARQKPGDIAEKIGNIEDEDEEMQDYLAVIRGTELGNITKGNEESDVNPTDLDFASSLISDRKIDLSKERAKASLAQRRIQKRRRPQSWAWTASSSSPDLKIDKKGDIDKEEISLSIELEDEGSAETPKRPCSKNRFSSPAFSESLLTDLGNVLKKSKGASPPKVAGVKTKPTIVQEEKTIFQSEPIIHTSHTSPILPPVQPAHETVMKSPIVYPHTKALGQENEENEFKTVIENVSPSSGERRIKSPIMHSAHPENTSESSPREFSPQFSVRNETNMHSCDENTRVPIETFKPINIVPMGELDRTEESPATGRHEAELSATEDMSLKSTEKFIPDIIKSSSPPIKPKPKPKPKVQSSSAFLAKAAVLSNQNKVAKEEAREAVSKNPNWLDELIRKKEQNAKNSLFSLPKNNDSNEESPLSTDSLNTKKSLPAWMQREVLKHEQDSKVDTEPFNGIIGNKIPSTSSEAMLKLTTRKPEVPKEEPFWLKELNKRKLNKGVKKEENKPDKPTVNHKDSNKEVFDFRSCAKQGEKVMQTKAANESSHDVISENVVNISHLKEKFSKNITATEQQEPTEIEPLHTDENNIVKINEQKGNVDVCKNKDIINDATDGKTKITEKIEQVVSSVDPSVDDIMLVEANFPQPENETAKGEISIVENDPSFDVGIGLMSNNISSLNTPITETSVTMQENATRNNLIHGSADKSYADSEEECLDKSLVTDERNKEKFVHPITALSGQKFTEPREGKVKIAETQQIDTEDQNKNYLSLEKSSEIENEILLINNPKESLAVEQTKAHQANHKKIERNEKSDNLSGSVVKVQTESTTSTALKKELHFASKPPPIKTKPKLIKNNRQKSKNHDDREAQLQPVVQNTISSGQDSSPDKSFGYRAGNEGQQAQSTALQEDRQVSEDGPSSPMQQEALVEKGNNQRNKSQDKKTEASEDIPKPLRVKLVRINSFEQGALKKPDFEKSKDNLGKETSTSKDPNQSQPVTHGLEKRNDHAVRSKIQEDMVGSDNSRSDKFVQRKNTEVNKGTVDNKEEGCINEKEKVKKKPLPPLIKPKPKPRAKQSKEQAGPTDINAVKINKKEDEENMNRITKGPVVDEVNKLNQDENINKNGLLMKSPAVSDKPAESVLLRERSTNTSKGPRPVSMVENTTPLSRQYPKRDRTSSTSTSSRRFSTELERKQNSCWFRGVIPEKIENFDEFEDIPAWKKQLLARLRVTGKPEKKPIQQESSGELKIENNLASQTRAISTPTGASKESTKYDDIISNETQETFKKRENMKVQTSKLVEAKIADQLSSLGESMANEPTGFEKQRDEEWV